jgi:hypothetical protein
MENIELSSKVPIPVSHSETNEEFSNSEPQDNIAYTTPTEYVSTQRGDNSNFLDSLTPDNCASSTENVYLENPQDKTRKNSLIRKIGQYKAVFGEELNELDLRNLYQRSLPELEELAETVEFLVSTRRSVKAAQGMFLGAVNVAELMAPKIGMDLSGLTVLTSKSSEILETVTECSIKYSQSIQVDPIHRLGLHMLQLALAVDTHNKKMKASPAPSDSLKSEPLKEQIPEQIPTEPQQVTEPLENIAENITENITEINERRQNLMQGL